MKIDELKLKKNPRDINCHPCIGGNLAFFLLALLLSLTACTDYEAVVEDNYEEWVATKGLIDSSTAVKSDFTDDRDGQIYKTVKIGEQTWMAQNLNYAYNEPTEELDSSSFCYENEPDSCAKYGRLYLWSAAMDSAAVFSDDGKGCGYSSTCNLSGTVRGVCPEGWHLPSQEEWNTLLAAVGGFSTAATMLKSQTGWNSYSGVPAGSDAYNFSALPAGVYYSNGSFTDVGYDAYFWSFSEDDNDLVYSVNLYYYNVYAFQNFIPKLYAFSVRCLKNSNDKAKFSSSAKSSSSVWSNSSVKSSSSAKSSSSVKSSSSGKSSSSAKSSLLVVCSSSAISSSSAKSSSSVKDESEYDAVARTLTDKRNGQVYKIVQIGNQTWMAENLNFDYNEGTAKSYCYDNSADSCAKYGHLYRRSAAMDSAAVFSDDGKGCGSGPICNASGTIRGVCPDGWHLPSAKEWKTLFSAVGGSSTAGTMLKSQSGWYNSGNGSDAYGFSALPAGDWGYHDEDFRNAGKYTYFWSSSFAYSIGFDYSYESVDQFVGDMSRGLYSVRCLKNSNEEAKVKDGSEYDAVAQTLTDKRDGQVYKTVKIGEQTWMAKNLNYAYDEPTVQEDSSSFCFGNEQDSCVKFGRLYLWSAAMDSAAVFSDDGKGCGNNKKCSASEPVRGVCPEGWHLPSMAEWNTLFTAVGGKDNAGTMLKSQAGWISDGNGEDTYGFSALPAGRRGYDGDFGSAGDFARFWSSSEYDSDYAYRMNLDYDIEYAGLNYGSRDYAFSVRCLKN